MRKILIGGIMATDMSRHFELTTKLQTGDKEKLSAMAAAFGQWSRASADSPSLIPLRNGKRPTQLVELA